MDGLIACFLGRLGQDAELRYLPNGTALLKFSALVWDSKAPADAAGEWIKVAVFGEAGEDLAPRLLKGVEVYVEGRLRLDRWVSSSGEPRFGLSLNAWTCEPLGQIGRRRPKRAEPSTMEMAG